MNTKIIINRKLKNNIICLYGFIISYYLFYFSLEKCLEGEDKCCQKIKWIKVKLIEEILSSILLSVLCELIILKIIQKFHLLHFIFTFILFYKYSHGIDFDDHGYYNFFGFFLIILIFHTLFLPINLIIYSKKKKLLLFYIILIIIISNLIYFLIINKLINCEDWPKGLNNTLIDNNINKYGCQIKIPKECPYKIGKFFLDQTKLFGIKCKNSNKNAKKIILKLSSSPFINNHTKKFGYPLMNKDQFCFEYDKLLRNYFINNLIDMDNKTLIKNLNNARPEIEVDFSKNPFGEMIINLNFNETLSNERKKLEKFIKPYSNNIIILFIDSVSRANSIRQLKKTLKFFEQFMKYKGNYNYNFPLENFHSFQFFKYHSFKTYTVGNYPILFYGNFRNKNNEIIIKFLKKNGFITSYSADICLKDFTNTFHNFTVKDIYDHKFISCDPNTHHPYQSRLRCLYNKIHSEHLYEYGYQFWRKYKDNRRFLTILTNDGHEGTLEVLKYVDDIIYNFLNNLFNENGLKETSVFLLSDHGVATPSIYYLYNFFKYEKQLPMLYLLINDRKNISYKEQYKDLNENQQTFITAFDIFNTIEHLIYGDKYYSIQKKNFKTSPKLKYGSSLFTKINKKYRSSKMYIPMAKDVCI